MNERSYTSRNHNDCVLGLYKLSELKIWYAIKLKNTSLSHRICSYFIDIEHLGEDMKAIWCIFCLKQLMCLAQFG